jgi:hypothetical protein
MCPEYFRVKTCKCMSHAANTRVCKVEFLFSSNSMNSHTNFKVRTCCKTVSVQRRAFHSLQPQALSCPCLSHPHTLPFPSFPFFFFFLGGAVLGFELRDLHLLDNALPLQPLPRPGTVTFRRHFAKFFP